MPFSPADLWAQLCLFIFRKEKKHNLLDAIGVIFLGLLNVSIFYLDQKYLAPRKINNATYDLRHKTC